jgi:hypothetical protein
VYIRIRFGAHFKVRENFSCENIRLEIHHHMQAEKFL